MPATYAHYIYGQKCLEVLPSNIKEIVNKYIDLYNIGVHGPDLLFYYKPYKHNKILECGYGMHPKKASEFFNKARIAYANSKLDKEALLAYLLGFCSHFALDTTCHSYVEAKEYYSKVTHTEIETEFDAYLMNRDKLNPISHNLVSHLKPTKFNAEVIQTFFNEFSSKQILECIKGFIFYEKVFICPNAIKRTSVIKALELAGQKTMKYKIVNTKPNPICEDSNLRLEKLAEKAIPLYKEIAPNLFDYLNGQANLDEIFNQTFGALEGWENIPVLNIDKEKEYEI